MTLDFGFSTSFFKHIKFGFLKTLYVYSMIFSEFYVRVCMYNFLIFNVCIRTVLIVYFVYSDQEPREI